MSENRKELTLQEKQQLALLAAKLIMEKTELDYDPATPEGAKKLAIDLADTYCEVMKVYNSKLAHWYY